MPRLVEVVVPRSGSPRFVYTDGFDLSGRHPVRIFRASTVEPVQRPDIDDRRWFWEVDLSPVGGPRTVCDEDGRPFESREAAIAWEVRWLREHLCSLKV